MNIDEIRDLQKKLKRELDAGRYEHTLGVMYTCGAMAMRYDADLNQAMAAGLLHDCAKCIPNSKKIKMCEKNGIEITELERRNPFLLHAKLGAFLSMREYGIQDQAIVSAIHNHTTGKPDMTLLEKIVYIADYIEPGRNKAENLPLVRRLAFIDLDLTLYQILRDTLTYLDSSDGETDEMTRRAYEFYRKWYETAYPEGSEYIPD